MISKILSVFIAFVFCHASAAEWQNNSQIAKLFEEAEVEGTFVLFDVSQDSFTGFNPKRAKQRFIPASTFKVANTLIGLSTGAVKSVDEILPYGGKPQFIKAWENDMSLRDAIKISNVPIYQELARRIGLSAMQENIVKLNYGNNNIGDVVDRFWLAGPIMISAIEQSEFLANLALNKLPFSKEHQKAVVEILEIERSKNGILYAKSGWTTAPDPDTGWWVGWIKREGKIYSFALNIDIKSDADVAKRERLARASLKILGFL